MNQANSTNTFQSPQGFYRLPQILELIPIGRSTWWKWCAEGKAPKGTKLGAKTTVWKASAIHQLINELEGEA